ncbi:hypothetical protein KKG41_03090 [Patescibacteria group bacterium]|nr:hypothetical protein [Patescibacteria group bacterium]MBU1890257.1 hypothetical protein [Patescibacteria group bacterium]
MKRVIILIVLIVTITPSTVFAATAINQDSYNLKANEQVEGTLYAGTGALNIKGVVGGDVVAGAGTVDISGDVNGDLLIGAGTINISGNGIEDVRVAGGQINLSSQITGDLLVFGGTVNIDPSAVVGGDLICGAGKINIDGMVQGAIIGGAGEIIISGEVGDDIEIIIEDLTLEDTAKVGGDLKYTAPHKATISSSAIISGQTTYTERSTEYFGGAISVVLGASIVGWLIKFITLLVAALAFYFILKGYSRNIVNSGLGGFWKQLLIGLIILIITPVAAIILFSTLIGSIIGVVLALLYVVLMFMAWIYSGILLGAWLMRFTRKDKKFAGDWVSVLVGVILIQLISLIPIVGWIFAFIFFLVALGSVSLTEWKLLKGELQF